MHILNTVYIYLLRMLCVPELLIQTATTEMHSILDCNIRKINGYFMMYDSYFSKYIGILLTGILATDLL